MKMGSMYFGPFELSTESSELRKHGQRLKLSGQAIDVLLLLVSNAGKLVTREELQRKLWPGDSFGDFEHGLNAAVNRLRETLGDSATEPTYIETIPRRGHPFIGEILFAEIRRHKGVLAMTLVGVAVLMAGLGMYFSRLNGRGIEWNQ